MRDLIYPVIGAAMALLLVQFMRPLYAALVIGALLAVLAAVHIELP
jgi:hypothetical protein